MNAQMNEPNAGEPIASDKIVLDFVGLTDFAAAIRPSYHCPGAVKLASYFSYFKALNPEGTVLVDAGDILCGAPIINLTHGEPVVDIVNLFGYDAMTLGNHEFDYGKVIMKNTLSRAAFPLLCANIVDRETGGLLDFVEPYVIIEKRGVKIGILGVTTEYTPYMVKKESFEPFEMLSVVDTCRRYIPILKQAGVEIIVVLGHLPGQVEENGDCVGELFKIAREVEGIDILFGGHNLGDVAVTLGNTHVSKTGFSARSIGHIQIEFDRSSKQLRCLVNEIVPVLEGTLPVRPDPLVEAAVQEALQPYLPVLDEVLGEAKDDLVVSFDEECSLGNFFTDCMKEACDAQIGLMNSTSCFGYMPRGKITSEMIMWVMCFNDNLHKGWMTGQQIKAMLELTYVQSHHNLNGSLQLSGLKVVLDTAKPEFERVVSITLADGTPLDDSQAYLVATSAYLASGGNGYRDITSLTSWEKTDLMTHPVFIEKMKARQSLSSTTEGRILDLA
jgi:2',3'-cyclic-nucleotide 2'-phosphodiesterase (5'-nucleotidase family)